MSKLVTSQPAPAGDGSSPVSGSTGVLTAERWLAVLVLGSFAFLAITRRQFREFIPR